MSTDIVLPTLTQWTENHVTAVLSATNEKDLNTALDAFLSKNATIIINGVHISRAEFERRLISEKFEQLTATFSFLGTVQVPENKEKPFDAGSVGLFYNAFITKEHNVRKLIASINVVIEQDPSLSKPLEYAIRPRIPFDARRVKNLDQVIAEAPEILHNAE